MIKSQIKIVIDEDERSDAEDPAHSSGEDVVRSEESSEEVRENEDARSSLTPISLPSTTGLLPPPTDGPVVGINSGKIEGKRTDENRSIAKASSDRDLNLSDSMETFNLGIPAGNGTVHKFFGIPFAEQPIDDLRFKHPITVKPWGTKIVQAKTKPFPCLQGPFYINRCVDSLTREYISRSFP